MTPPVLIVGAGPTGLTAACALRGLGVPCRIVDRRRGPGVAPKGLVLWSGALECLHRLGVARTLAAEALPLAGASYWSRGRRIGGVRFGGLRGTAFPGPLCVPQPVTEQALHTRLEELGGTVEWETEATDLTVHGAGDGAAVSVVLRSSGGTEEVTVPWLIGADGARSTVRESVGIPFDGHTFDRTFLIGDGVLSGAPDEAEVQHHIAPDGVLVIVPQPGGHRVFFDLESDGRSDPPSSALLQRLLDQRGPGGLRFHDAWWTSRFQVHAKVAPRFRAGPVLLAGDAVHAHTTAGGQGLNTGVQDGYDIGWKLAAVVRGQDPALLDSFEAERRPASVRAVRNGDQQIRLWLLRRPLARAARDTALRALSGAGLLESRVIPLLAQLDLDHSGSPAVADLAGAADAPRAVRTGRRAPDAALVPVHGPAALTLHAHLAEGRHTLLAYGGQAAGERAAHAAGVLHRRGADDAVTVLWIQPPGTAADPGRAIAAGARVAREPGHGALRGGCAGWLALVRPDGVLAARAGLTGLDALLDRLPRERALPAPARAGRS
ncbi:FAD-dependent monooxygenase [Streptomyces clavuligerus]|uniref:Monooxygenase n=1 Tax=Streptomyces clavuligerus TaxID=1901 RepID=E2Q9C6_STRCL|nr:FAD-dependent monooxygenase [Streptomyces clavuligerus]ANW21329.1 oxygenase [Streptomyces clavuligerus]AXU15955.1 oxygenase [Streptomyces clavuligerus]EFG05546.1 Monooxygenase [Streptomyces clavuligerus]MBY6306085.1 FAD-dependent monooxygenase [Streptomyces clavuligerus]QCS08735.1 oxygenase [Streptomyces clavuligerus]